MTKLITKQQIAENYDMEEIVSEVEKAYKQLGEGNITMPDRLFMSTRGEGDVLSAPVYLKESGFLGIKTSSFTPDNDKRNLPIVNGVYILFNAETGLVECIMDSELLTAFRTGAKSALAVKYLARKDSKSLGVLGMGKQAKTQVEAISKVLKLEMVLLWSREPKKHEDLIEFIGSLGLKTEVLKDPNEIAKHADILIDATYSTEPLVKTKNIKPGTMVIGINHHSKYQEFDTELIAKSKVFVDYKQNLHAGTLSAPVKEGKIKAEDIVELSAVILSGKDQRVKADEYLYFQSGGVSLEDLAAAIALYNKIEKKAEDFDFAG